MSSIADTLRRLLGISSRKENPINTVDDDRVYPTRVPNNTIFRTPWHPTSSMLHQELRGECASGHVLYGVTARAVAHRQDCDDVLFELFGENAPAEFAVVHLTWGPHPDRHEGYPSTQLYATFDEWLTTCMILEADEWGDDDDA